MPVLGDADSNKPNETVVIPPSEYSSITILLHVMKNNQTNETLALFKTLLAKSANQFIESEKLSLEQCTPAHVTLLNVAQCSRAWQNGINCLKIRLAIPLKAKIPLKKRDLDSQKVEYELTRDHLVGMWILFGQKELLASGYPVRLFPRIWIFDELIFFVAGIHST